MILIKIIKIKSYRYKIRIYDKNKININILN